MSNIEKTMKTMNNIEKPMKIMKNIEKTMKHNEKQTMKNIERNNEVAFAKYSQLETPLLRFTK